MLKIVRSGSRPLAGVVIGGKSLEPMKAQEVQFKCSLCKHTSRVQVPWGATPEKRQSLIQRALYEHRVIVCTVKDSAARRTYEITYPRG